ncbi:MAG TPA: long-chain fatty acid--CoA ligase [Clostridia bacterium]|nr:long-chain fatty acid--CoA ligase [Clostridia bacterium]
MSLIKVLEENGELFADAMAVIDSGTGETLTYRELWQRINALAAGLASLGVRKGDRVALYLPNGAPFIISFFAALRIGALAVPFNIQLKQYEIAQVLGHAQPQVIIGAAEELEAEVAPVLAQLPAAPKIVKVGAGSNIGPGEKDFDFLLAHAPLQGLPVPADRDPAAIYYTSGTTGVMKGALVTHGNLVSIAKINGHYLLGLNNQDRVLGIAPYSHVYFFQVVLGPLVVGAAAVTLPRPSPRLALAVMEKYRVTHVSTVPTMFRYLLRHYREGHYDVSSWRVAGSAATSIPLSLVQEIKETFGVDFFDTYGCTETSSTITYTRLRHYKPGSVGPPAHGVKVKFIDEAEREVPVGEIGEIAVQSPGVFAGYWRDPEKTRESFTRDGWFKTGDLGYRDEEGYIYIAGRKKDVIISGGYNIYPWEVEQLLLGHPQVAEAAVVGRPDPDLGEKPVAYLVLKPGCRPSPEEFIAFCHQHLAKYKCPRQVVFLESLPKSGSGKVLKKLLR